jgi:hypothetical protein
MHRAFVKNLNFIQSEANNRRWRKPRDFPQRAAMSGIPG